jgi:hypothetical protein
MPNNSGLSVKISSLSVKGIGTKGNNAAFAIEKRMVRPSGATFVLGFQYAKLKSDTTGMDDYSFGEMYVGIGITEFLPNDCEVYVMPKLYAGRISNNVISKGTWNLTGAIGAAYNMDKVSVGVEAELGKVKIVGEDSHSRNSIGAYVTLHF